MTLTPRRPIRLRRSRDRRRARSLARAATLDAGFAMPTAVIVLFVITLLLAAAISVATQTSTSTTRDNNVKAEIEAAEAGLQVATYRLTQLKPSETQCINESAVVTAASTAAAASNCKDSAESLGNGATYQYWTSLPLKAGESCAGRTIATVPLTVQRCVTAEGIVNSVKPGVRVQSTVTSTHTSTPIFPVNGLLGLEGVEIVNNAKVNAKTATNGKLSVGNGASVESVALGSSSPATTPEGGGSWGPVTREATTFSLPAVNTGTSATVNFNYRIENGINKTTPADEGTGVTYTKSTRTLTLANNGKLELGGEIYNLCNLTTGNGVEITLKAGVTTKLYIDSPNDPGSGCKAGDGKFVIGNNSVVTNPSKEANKFQVYVYDASGGAVEVSNNTTPYYGTIYAPNSEVQLNNNGGFVGAIAAKKVNLKNNGSFSSEAAVANLTTEGAPGAYLRKVWEQCTPGSGASEGC
jgi:Tfp pilus assembly protein PilX